MISADFAPNETLSDALLSLKLLFKPRAWYEGRSLETVRTYLGRLFPGSTVHLHLSGRATLNRVLHNLGLPPGSEVAVTGFTCEAVVLPVMAARLIPVYIDVERETLGMDVSVLRKRITPHTRVIILQHTFGMAPRDRDGVLQLAKEHNLFVIEDLAHGFDPSDSQKYAPSARTALLLSFGRSKALSSVFGGALITSKQSELKFDRTESLPRVSNGFLMRLLLYKPLAFFIKKTGAWGIGKAVHHMTKSLGLQVAEISKNEKRGVYDPFLDAPYPNALAALLAKQIGVFDINIKRRRTVSEYYRLNLRTGGKEDIRWFGADVPFVRFPLLVPHRNKLVSFCRSRGMYLGTWYTQPVAPYPLPLPSVMYIIGSCPVAESVCRDIVNLPTLVSDGEAKSIAETINSFYHA